MEKIKSFFRKYFNIPYCRKTDMGYNCHHRINANGTKECD